MRRIRERLRAEMRALRGSNAPHGRSRLNPIIRGWSAYYRHAVSGRGVQRAGQLPVEAHLQVGQVQPSDTSRSAGSSPGTSARSTRPGGTGGCSVTATAAPTCSSSPGPTIIRHTMVKGWASPDDPALADYWGQRRRHGAPADRQGQPAAAHKPSTGAARSAGDLLLHADDEPQHPRRVGTVAHGRPARRSRHRSLIAAGPEHRTSTTTPSHTHPLPPTAAAASTSARLRARGACLSRVPGKRARPVLRGPAAQQCAAGYPTGSRSTTCWRPHGFEVMLVNAKARQGTCRAARPMCSDAVWLAQLGAHGAGARLSFVPPEPIRQLRDLTRYRTALTGERTRGDAAAGEGARGRRDQAVLGGLQHLRGVRRAMLDALIAGERDPAVLAEMARRALRGKIPSWSRRCRAGSPTTTRSWCACTWPSSTSTAPRSTR